MKREGGDEGVLHGKTYASYESGSVNIKPRERERETEKGGGVYLPDASLFHKISWPRCGRLFLLIAYQVWEAFVFLFCFLKRRRSRPRFPFVRWLTLSLYLRPLVPHLYPTLSFSARFCPFAGSKRSSHEQYTDCIQPDIMQHSANSSF